MKTARHRIHYAWVICGAGMLLMLCNMGLCSNIFAVYLPFIKSSGLTGTQGSSIISIRCVLSFLCSFPVTALYGKISLRKGATAATCLGALSSVIFSVGGSPMVYYLAAAVAGAAYGFGTIIPVSLLMSNWFAERRGLALGICSAGTGIATVIFAPLITAGVLKYGLQTVYLAQAAFMLLCAVAVFCAIRETPEEKGLQPFGKNSTAEKADVSDETVGRDFTIPVGMWILLGLMMLFSGGSGQAASSHISILATTAGYSHETVGMVTSLYGLAMIFGKFAFGGIADAVSVKKASVLFMFAYIFGCLMSLTLNGNAVFCAVVFAIVLGAGCAFFNVGFPLWASELSSRNENRETLRRFQILYSAGGIVFTPIPGMIADRTGEYKSSYLLLGLLIAATVGILLHAYRKRRTEYRPHP